MLGGLRRTRLARSGEYLRDSPQQHWIDRSRETRRADAVIRTTEQKRQAPVCLERDSVCVPFPFLPAPWVAPTRVFVVVTTHRHGFGILEDVDASSHRQHVPYVLPPHLLAQLLQEMHSHLFPRHSSRRLCATSHPTHP